MTHKIYLTKVKTGKRGLLYDVAYDGEVICQSSMTPLLDAARTLASRGMEGNLEMWDNVRPYPRMKSTITKASLLSVIDRGSGPVFSKYNPRPTADDGNFNESDT